MQMSGSLSDSCASSWASLLLLVCLAQVQYNILCSYNNFSFVIFHDYLLVVCTFVIIDRKGVDLDAWEAGRNLEDREGNHN